MVTTGDTFGLAEDEVKPVERKQHTCLRRAKKRHAAEHVRIPKRHIAGTDQISDDDPHGYVKNYAVIWRDNEIAGGGGEEIDER